MAGDLVFTRFPLGFHLAFFLEEPSCVKIKNDVENMRNLSRKVVGKSDKINIFVNVTDFVGGHFDGLTDC